MDKWENTWYDSDVSFEYLIILNWWNSNSFVLIYWDILLKVDHSLTLQN